MKLNQLIQDEDAVSPVIGVILMVAITVILAAVIGTFVLGLGQNVQSTPSASFDFDLDGGGDGFSGGSANDIVSITHNGGDTIDAARLSVNIDGTDASTISEVSRTSSFGSEVSSGSTAEYEEDSTDGLASGDNIRVVFTGESGDTSATLGQTTLP